MVPLQPFLGSYSATYWPTSLRETLLPLVAALLVPGLFSELILPRISRKAFSKSSACSTA